MRKLLSTIAAILAAAGLAGTIAYTSNIALFTSSSPCFDSSQTLACANAVVQGVNAGVTGNFAFTPGPVGNTGSGTTTANITFASATVATGTLVAAGQGMRARCAGISTIATAYKVGIAVGRSMAISQENFPVGGAQPNNSNWDLQLEFRAATQPVTANIVWEGRGFAAIATGTVSGATLSVNSGNDTTVTDNNVNFPLPVTCVMYGGAASGSVTMMNFSVEVMR